MAPTLRDAANACITGWMGGTALDANDPKWMALEEYLQSISRITSYNVCYTKLLRDCLLVTSWSGRRIRSAPRSRVHPRSSQCDRNGSAAGGWRQPNRLG